MTDEELLSMTSDDAIIKEAVKLISCSKCKYYYNWKSDDGRWNTCIKEESQISQPKPDYGCIYFEK